MHWGSVSCALSCSLCYSFCLGHHHFCLPGQRPRPFLQHRNRNHRMTRKKNPMMIHRSIRLRVLVRGIYSILEVTKSCVSTRRRKQKEGRCYSPPFDDFFPIPSLSTTLSSHCTLGPGLAVCSPRSLKIGACACVCASVWVCEPVLGSAVRVLFICPPPEPLDDGPVADDDVPCAIFRLTAIVRC